MKEIYIDGTLEPIETANWFPKVIRKNYTVGTNISETTVDDPDQMLYENYACGSDRNYTGFCDDRQSAEPNAEKRRQLVWEIERRLARDASRRQAGGSAGGAARPATQRDDYCVVLDALGETGAQWPGRYFPFAA